MRILIIGGTRFVGPRVARRLAMLGHDVTVFHRGIHSSPLPDKVAEITDPAAAMPVCHVPESLRALVPEVVLHMIAMGEADMQAAVDAFAGVARRIIVPSSGDVYKAYGVFTGIEEGPVVPVPLSEDAPLRNVRHPYRRPDTPQAALEYYYDKILVEGVAASRPELPATILRLPKVYGPEDNAELDTIYGFRDHPSWRWTHGYVDNVAAAIVLAITNETATGRTYNVGEEFTPTMAERLEFLPSRPDAPLLGKQGNFAQDIAYDTSRIRRELGFRDIVHERTAMVELLRTQTSGD